MLLHRTPPPQYPTTIRGTAAKDERPRRNRSGKAVSPPPQPFAGPPRSVPVSPVVASAALRVLYNRFSLRNPEVDGVRDFPDFFSRFPPCSVKVLVERFTTPSVGPPSACNSAAAGPSVVEKLCKPPETRRRDPPNPLSRPPPCTRREIGTP